MAIETSSLTTLVTEFRAINAKDSITPESLGYILQCIIDLLGTASDAESVESIRKTLEELTTEVNANTKSCGSLQTDLNALTKRVTNNESSIQTNAGSITSLQNTVNQLGTAVGTNTSNISNNSNEIANLKKELTSITETLGETENNTDDATLINLSWEEGTIYTTLVGAIADVPLERRLCGTIVTFRLRARNSSHISMVSYQYTIAGDYAEEDWLNDDNWQRYDRGTLENTVNAIEEEVTTLTQKMSTLSDDEGLTGALVYKRAISYDDEYYANSSYDSDGTNGGLPNAKGTAVAVGWTYRITAASTYAGQACNAGDWLVCIKAHTCAGDASTLTSTYWARIIGNIDLVLVDGNLTSISSISNETIDEIINQ